jgi:CRP-like cAMP-binding protein
MVAQIGRDLLERAATLVPLNGLGATYRKQVLEQGRLRRCKAGDTVFRAGDLDPLCIYLLEGRVDFKVGDEVVFKLEGKDPAASHPLGHFETQATGIVTSPEALVLVLNRVLIDRCLLLESTHSGPGTPATEAEMGWMARMLQSEIFMRVAAANISRIFTKLEPVNFSAGQVVVRQGEPGEHYFIIREGHCEVLRQAGGGGPAVKLAELAPGDAFGEEALVTGARRNATVRMMSDGVLMRLTKDDFVELIKKPLIKDLSFHRAAEMVRAQGALWLDVRLPEEYQVSHLPGAINLPLGDLRQSFDKLDVGKRHIVYCDTGSRSLVGAFLIKERGFDAYHLNGGLLKAITAIGGGDGAAAAGGFDGTVAEGPSAFVSVGDYMKSHLAGEGQTPSGLDPTVAAEVRVASLKAALAQAHQELESGRRIRAEAEETRQRELKALQACIQEERRRFEEQASRSAAEVERLRVELERAKIEASQIVKETKKQEEEGLAQIKSEAEQRLQDGQERLEKAYEHQAEAMGRVQQRIRDRIEASRADIDLPDTLRTAGGLGSLVSPPTLTEMESADSVRRIHEKIRERLAQERKKLEVEFVDKAQRIEEVERNQRAKDAGRAAATAEAERIIGEVQEAASPPVPVAAPAIPAARPAGAAAPPVAAPAIPAARPAGAAAPPAAAPAIPAAARPTGAAAPPAAAPPAVPATPTARPAGAAAPPAAAPPAAVQPTPAAVPPVVQVAGTGELARLAEEIQECQVEKDSLRKEQKRAEGRQDEIRMLLAMGGGRSDVADKKSAELAQLEAQVKDFKKKIAAVTARQQVLIARQEELIPPAIVDPATAATAAPTDIGRSAFLMGQHMEHVGRIRRHAEEASDLASNHNQNLIDELSSQLPDE